MSYVTLVVNPEFLKIALKYGGDPNFTFYNPKYQKTEEGKYILYGDNGATLLMRVLATENAFEKVKILVEAGANINAQDAQGDTVLIASLPIHFDIAYYLLEKGADYTIKNKVNGKAIDVIEKRFLISPFGDKNFIINQIKWRRKVIEFFKEKGIKIKLEYDDEWHFKEYGIKPF